MMCAAPAPPAAAAAAFSSPGAGGLGFLPVPPAAAASSSSCMAGAQEGGQGPQADCRSRYQLLLSGKALAERYRQIYTAAVTDREQQAGHSARNKKILSKKKLKRKQKTKSKGKLRCKADNLENSLFIPDLKLHSNPSAFSVYCNVRHCVLEWQRKETSLIISSKSSVQSGESDSDEEEESKEPPIKLPKLIPVFLKIYCQC
ncbi:E3 ubiquitin- ligase MYCBP2 [Pelobates cultripes]|uniref:E3 ubiquitin- ligase MYCBP2 n=1 Tax=Pelobates cultripes TaxID=61616 RepID=A0AAD1VQ51_PELCU|nr:E3 ubiquitin- ligase MYCBP2 [Pelobates cultripes]